MERYLFRGKRLDTKEWVYGCLVYNYDPHQVDNVVSDCFIRQPIRNLATLIEVDPKTVGQLHSRLSRLAGTDIFVGDKIQHDLEIDPNAENGTQERIAGMITVVETIEHHYLWHSNIRLIGNIHEEITN